MRLNIVQPIISAKVSMLELCLPNQLLLVLPIGRIEGIAEEVEVRSRSSHIFFDFCPKRLVIEVAIPVGLV